MKQINLENKHLAAFFFMLAMVFFGLMMYNLVYSNMATINTMNVIMFFFCFILSMSFKTWALIRDMDDKFDLLIRTKVI